MNRELITVQVGTYSNFIASHLWNLQHQQLSTPSLSHQLSPTTFLEQLTPSSALYSSGSRYVPRVQIIDASGAFGALSSPSGRVLASDQRPTDNAPAWHASLQRFHTDPIHHSSFVKYLHQRQKPSSAPHHPFQLNDVEYWSDYLQPQLHPRSCFQLPGTHHNTTNLLHFSTGTDIAQNLVHHMFDDLRKFLESSDYPGGLVFCTNSDDAFSGITSSYLHHVEEELSSNHPILVFGVQNLARNCTPRTASRFGSVFDKPSEMTWSTNEALLVSTCLEYNVQYVPLSSQPLHDLSAFQITKGDPYHTSAALSVPLSVALTPLQCGTSLPGLFSGVRMKPNWCFSGLQANIPSLKARLDFSRTLAQTTGTVNFSDVWRTTAAGNPSGIGSQAEVTSARGILSNLPIACDVKEAVRLPISFPHILQRDFAGKSANTKPASVDSALDKYLQVVSGLITNPEDARLALRTLGMSKCPPSGIEKESFAEEIEVLKSRTDDFSYD